MNLPVARRLLSAFILISLIAVKLSALADSQPMKYNANISVEKQLAALEASFGGRLGIAAIDTSTHQFIYYRANERFPMGCTSKVIGVSAILKKSMLDRRYLQEKVIYHKKDLLAWAPITKEHLTDGMTIEQLCAAAISYSDNTAMNLLVKKLGGLQSVNTFARSMGDNFFKLDHWWPEEGLSNSFDSKDSSTPAAMESSLEKLALGNVLASTQREKLLTWLRANTTGNARIRAGVPKGWMVGDKTGTGFYYGTANDIGIIWSPHCQPIVVAIFTTSNKKDAPKREDVIASATQLVINEFAHTDTCVKQHSV